MADNTNAQAVRFTSEETRVACDVFISALRTIRQCVADYSAKGVGPLVAGTLELQQAYVADGSASDGRTLLLGYDVDLANSAMAAFLAWADGPGAAHVAALTKPAVNTLPKF